MISISRCAQIPKNKKAATLGDVSEILTCAFEYFMISKKERFESQMCSHFNRIAAVVLLCFVFELFCIFTNIV